LPHNACEVCNYLKEKGIGFGSGIAPLTTT